MSGRALTITASVFAAMILPTGASADAELLLWNKLGSQAEVLGSEIGPSFEIIEENGHVLFDPFVEDSVFGGAVATTGGTGASTAPAGGYLAMNPDDFFPVDKTQGTVEFWAQKRISRIHPYESPLVTFFGPTYFGTGYYAIVGMWTNTPEGLAFLIYHDTSDSVIVTDPSWEEVDVGEWVHLAFVWDGSGIEGGRDDLRIYRDGMLVASHQGTFSQVARRCCVGYSCGESQCDSGGYELRVLANHQGQRFTDCSPYLAHGDDCLCDSSQYPSGYCPAAYMDNIKVWNYAKTDFSDRFVEGLTVLIDIKPWSDVNRINLFGKGVLPVAILGSDAFDVAEVDVTTLAFGPGGAAPLLGSGFPWNVNGDAFTDLVSFYRIPDTSIALGDTEACLTGKTLEGTSFEGCDGITTVSCGLGAELVFLLPPLMWLYGRRRHARA